MIIHHPFVGEKFFSYAFGLFSDDWIRCFGISNFSERTEQNDFFGNTFRNVK